MRFPLTSCPKPTLTALLWPSNHSNFTQARAKSPQFGALQEEGRV